MKTEKNKVERILHLNLEVTDKWICVTSIDNETGETYTLDFQNERDRYGAWVGEYRKPENIMMRIGMEVWPWIQIMFDEYDAVDEDGK
jgi:hypothetical protein